MVMLFVMDALKENHLDSNYCTGTVTILRCFAGSGVGKCHPARRKCQFYSHFLLFSFPICFPRVEALLSAFNPPVFILSLSVLVHWGLTRGLLSCQLFSVYCLTFIWLFCFFRSWNSLICLFPEGLDVFQQIQYPNFVWFIFFNSYYSIQPH